MAEPSANAPMNTTTNSPTLCRMPIPFSSELFGPVMYFSIDLHHKHTQQICLSVAGPMTFNALLDQLCGPSVNTAPFMTLKDTILNLLPRSVP